MYRDHKDGVDPTKETEECLLRGYYVRRQHLNREIKEEVKKEYLSVSNAADKLGKLRRGEVSVVSDEDYW